MTFCFLLVFHCFLITALDLSFIDHAFAALGIGGLMPPCLCFLVMAMDFVGVGCGSWCYHCHRDNVHRTLNMTNPQSKH